jgi:hypothetical protein
MLGFRQRSFAHAPPGSKIKTVRVSVKQDNASKDKDQRDDCSNGKPFDWELCRANAEYGGSVIKQSGLTATKDGGRNIAARMLSIAIDWP